jgi:tetratricopeptide (TPR) repeat protein
MNEAMIETALRKSKELRAACKHNEAIDVLSEALVTGLDARLLASRARSFEMIGEAEQAVADLSGAILLEPERAEYYMNRGYVLSHGLHKDDEAIADFEKVVELDPGNLDAHHEWCISLLELKRLGEALEHALIAVKLDPGNATSHWCVGQTYMGLREFSNAVGWLARAVEIDPEQANYWSCLGNAHRFLGGARDSERAVQAYSRAICLNPKSAYYFYSRGHARLQMGMIAEATADLQHALTLNPDEATRLLINGRLRTLGENPAEKVGDGASLGPN